MRPPGARPQRAGRGHAGIRPACGADLGAIRQFLHGLSPRTRYLRFFTGAAPASCASLRLLAGAGRADAVVAVAIPGDRCGGGSGGSGGAIIGHAMAVDAPGPGGATVTEIGVVVADAWQGRGVGAALVRTLTARAQARGVTAMVMDVLPENRPVLTMIADHWPGARRRGQVDFITVHAPLPVAAATPASQPAGGWISGGRA